MRNTGKFIKRDLKVAETSKDGSSLAEIAEFEDCPFCTYAEYQLHTEFQSFLKNRTPLFFVLIGKSLQLKQKPD